jgi:hypothetical protein
MDVKTGKDLGSSNIIALTAVLLTFIGGYINIKSTQTEFNKGLQR